ncbi:MAG: hypothetical protein BWY76_01167 [bacterium ADurb.Bin429]|nr:MAG: hypothetical protein BWY76_01167 [bacterium ADurb.Bin429]
MAWPHVILAVMMLGGLLPAKAAEPTPAEVFQKEAAAKYAAADQAKSTVVTGKDGWLFFSYELRSMSVGKFWGPDAVAVNRVAKPEVADAIPAILDFKRQLDAADITLIVVPVPAKAAIYPDMFTTAITTPEPRVDITHQAFYKVLAEKGVTVLDLTPVFLKQRAAGGPALYCKQDTHWSSAGCAVTASELAALLKDKPWLKPVARRKLEMIAKEIEITGDLWTMLNNPDLTKEKLPIQVVQERTKDGLAPFKPWRESPVLLLGDSHTLVFHAGEDMLASGAGLADHLALQLGFPVDVVGVRGSGATPSRINLLRRGDNLAGKKAVIWCFSIREFTEGQGWRLVPVIK